MIEEIKAYLKKNPESKAKDIAKKLGCTTKEVNQLLHYTPDIFVQDKATYTWTLLPQDELLISCYSLYSYFLHAIKFFKN